MRKDIDLLLGVTQIGGGKHDRKKSDQGLFRNVGNTNQQCLRSGPPGEAPQPYR